MLLTLSRKMHDPAPGRCAGNRLHPGLLPRHLSFRRAVCVNALVRICAGAFRDRPYRDPNEETGPLYAFAQTRLRVMIESANAGNLVPTHVTACSNSGHLFRVDFANDSNKWLRVETYNRV